MANRKRKTTKSRQPKQTGQAASVEPVQQVKAEVVSPSVVNSTSKAVEPELTGIRQVVSNFRKSLEESGLGDLDFSELLSGKGLATPFVGGVQSAIKAENIQAVTAARSSGAADPESSLGNTAQNLKQFDKSVETITLNLGVALLPAINSIVTGLQPLLTSVGQFVADNPALVQGLAAAAVAFTMVASAAMVFAALLSPIGLAALAIAAVAGVVVANWQPVSRFFSQLWGLISPTVMKMVNVFKDIFSWTPLGQLVANWGPVSDYLGDLWQDVVDGVGPVYRALDLLFNMTGISALLRNWEPIKGALQSVFGLLREMVAWSPISLLTSNWQPMVDLFLAIWNLVGAISVVAMDSIKELFDWVPGDSILQWFSSLLEGMEKVLTPIREMFSGSFGKFIVKITGGIQSLTDSIQGTQLPDSQGEALARNEPGPWPAASLTKNHLVQNSTSLLQQTAANNRTQLEGGLMVSFTNAPQGLRVEQAKTNQPGLSVASTIGYRSLSLGGSYA